MQFLLSSPNTPSKKITKKKKSKAVKKDKKQEPELFYSYHPQYTSIRGPESIADIVEVYSQTFVNLDKVLLFPASTAKKLKSTHKYSLLPV